MRLESFVLETLGSPYVDKLNFQFGPMRVYPLGYRRDIAGCIRNGRIALRLGSTSGPAGSFAVDTPRGQIHPFVFNSRLIDERSGVLHLKSLSAREQADLRGTIIHESTHALQDWQRISLTPQMSEGPAYLAGAIARRLWGYRDLGPVPNPRVTGHAFALYLADRFLAAPVHSRYIIPANDVQVLVSLVSTGSADRYSFDGI
jgi:hypothetical protein